MIRASKTKISVCITAPLIGQFFQNQSIQSIQWKLLLFQQITGAPQPSPPITGSQLRWDNCLRGTEEAATAHKYRASQRDCHSSGIRHHSLKSYLRPREEHKTSDFTSELSPLHDKGRLKLPFATRVRSCIAPIAWNLHA